MKIAICDDEHHMLHNLKTRISGYFDKLNMGRQISCFSGGVPLLCSNQAFDIIIMDIKMPGMDGMKSIRHLRAKGCLSQVIFVTSSKDYVFQAFDVDTVHYLIKPVSDKELFHALDKAVKRCEQVDSRTITVTKGAAVHIIPLRKILYCEAVNHKMYICTTTGKVDCYCQLDSLQEQLDERFFRCHRSYLVNMNFVSGKERDSVIMENGDTVLVSRRKQPQFSQRLLSFIRGEVL